MHRHSCQGSHPSGKSCTDRPSDPRTPQVRLDSSTKLASCCQQAGQRPGHRLPSIEACIAAAALASQAHTMHTGSHPPLRLMLHPRAVVAHSLTAGYFGKQQTCVACTGAAAVAHAGVERGTDHPGNEESDSRMHAAPVNMIYTAASVRVVASPGTGSVLRGRGWCARGGDLGAHRPMYLSQPQRTTTLGQPSRPQEQNVPRPKRPPHLCHTRSAHR